MEQTVHINQKNNKRKSALISIIFHIILLLLILLPCMNYFDPPRESQGITILLGITEETESKKVPLNENQSTNQSSTPAKAAEKTILKATTAKSISKSDVKSKSSVEKSTVNSSSKKTKKTGPTPAEIEAQKRQVETEKAKAIAEKEAQEKADAKDKFGSLFNKNNKSNTTSNENPLGQPDTAALEELSEAFGKTGEGLKDRGIIYQPSITDNTQKTGRVVVKICVNKKGQVIFAKYTQKGSTTTDSHLIDLAESSARKYRFNQSEIEEQCGNIIIDFKLK